MKFRIRHKGMTIAAASGTHAEAEIMHYARQYRVDHEITIQVAHELPSGKSWKRHMLLAQFPQPTIAGATP